MAEHISQNYIPNARPIRGYASLFGVQDLGGDIVRKGAFAASLLKRGGAPLPMLFSHETAVPIGVWDRAIEDEKGLYVEGRFFKPDKPRRYISRLLQSGALTGLSIGYRALRFSARPAGGRDLFDLDLWEVSIVAFPMLRDARLTLSQSPNLSSHQFPKRTAL